MMPSAAKGGQVLVMLGILASASCCAQKPPPEKCPGFLQSSLPTPQLVQRINENNQAISTLYARQYLEANLFDKSRNKYIFVASHGDLFVRKPRELLLRGRHDLAGKIFEIGSADEVFWLNVYEGDSTRWWGHYRNLGKDCMDEMPVRPDLIGEVLGISDIPTNLVDPPFPTMRVNVDSCVYMMVWNVRGTRQWYSEKEVWYDHKTNLPVKVILYDRNGRPVVRANLSGHEAVEVANVPREKWPKIATSYSLLFPETRSTMTLRLSEPALLSKAGHPRPGSIVFREDPEISKVIQVDEACEK